AKLERDDLQQRQYENQQQYIKDQEKFISRFRAKASKATAVQSRVKKLDKLDKVDVVESDGPRVNLKFSINKESGKVIMELDKITKHFGTNRILTNATGDIIRKDKIALIGANGKGKSTLLRIIANTEKFSGERKEGYNVVTSFFAQHQLQALHLENEVLQELSEHGSGLLESELRNVLGCFLFAGDDVFKPIKVLSGGEKSRVALAKTLVEKANFLLLDEPTNHLDIQSIDVLIQALQQYEGSFVLVSHDRYFVTEVANKIWWIEDEQIREYPGNYTEYLYWKEKQDANNKQQPVATKKAAKPAKNPVKSDKEKKKQQEIRKVEQKIEQLESQVGDISKTLKQIETDLANPEITSDRQKLLDLSSQHQIQSDRKTELLAKSEALLEQLMELED
ncbi:MAG: ATP-binding cassette subfamily F protein 3, partial [Bacteroidia bacterium]